MPTEAYIKKAAIEEISKQGGIVWCPPKVKWIKESDIFGVFDGVIIYPPSNIVFIQWTSLPNIRARERKVKRWLRENKVSIYVEIWGFNQNWRIKENKTRFKVIHIYGK